MNNTAAFLGIIGFIAGLIVGMLYTPKKRGGPGEPEDEAPMPTGYRQMLVGYLLVVGLAIVWMLVSLAAVDLPEPALVPATASGQAGAAALDQNALWILDVFPQWTLGNLPTVSVAVYGQNFPQDAKVRVNMKPDTRPPTSLSTTLLKFDLQPEDLVNVGSISLEVVGNNKFSNVIVMPVVKPRASLNVFGWKAKITREVQLLLLVIVAGALGSYLHAIKSLTDFIGNRTLTASWYWWYISRPFLGMALATVFYAVLRSGFLAGTPADAKAVNPFGVIAIGALVGMFADKAAQKLAEIFDTLFKADDQRGGKLIAPVVDRIDPPSVVPGASPPPALKLIGDRLGKVSTVRLNAEERRPDTVTEKEITVKLRPEDITNVAQIKITAVNPDGGASPAVTFHVTKLEITTAAPLPNATVGTAWTQTFAATEGSPPYKWSLVAGPAWLSMDDKGELKGKPTSAGTQKATVKVVDAAGASVSKVYDVNVVEKPAG